MTNALSDRIKLAMKGPPKISGVKLAAACDVAAASVSDWRSGKTQTIEASNLLKAAECLKVRAKWLAEGVGPMRECLTQNHQVREPEKALYPDISPDKMTIEIVQLFSQLDKDSKLEFIGQMRGFVLGRIGRNREPPTEQTTPANNERTGTHD